MLGAMTTHYASPGGVRQHGGSLPIRTCKTCAEDIVWVTSQRTGKSYPVNISRGYHGQRFYMGHNVHRCEDTFAKRAAAEAEREALVAEEARVAAAHDLADQVLDMQRRYRAGEITKDEFVAWIETVNG